MDTHLTTNYSLDRVSFLKTVEGDTPIVHLVLGVPHFGVGLNLQTHGELLLQNLGFDFTERNQWKRNQ